MIVKFNCKRFFVSCFFFRQWPLLKDLSVESVPSHLMIKTFARVLSCGHSYCTGCLERLTIEDDKMSCPTCRVEVNLPPAGVAGLPKNFELLSIINTKVTPHHEEGERLYTCEACSDKHPATSFCLNCQGDV